MFSTAMFNTSQKNQRSALFTSSAFLVVALISVSIGSGEAFAQRGKSSSNIEAVVSPDLKSSNITKIAVESFTINGSDQKNSSIADIINTKLFSTGKYRHGNRSQGDEIGKLLAEELQYRDQALEILGVDALVRGTVTSYEMMSLGDRSVPSIGFSIKLVSLSNLEELWTLSASGVGKSGQNVGIFASELASQAIGRLVDEWLTVGDRTSVNLPKPNVQRITGGRSKATLEINPMKPDRYSGFAIYRSNSKNGSYQYVKTLRNKKSSRPLKFIDKKLASGKQYFYQVSAVATTGLYGPTSDPQSVTVD